MTRESIDLLSRAIPKHGLQSLRLHKAPLKLIM